MPLDAGRVLEEARSKLEQVYRQLLEELEADARRIVESKAAVVEEVKREIREALRV